MTKTKAQMAKRSFVSEARIVGEDVGGPDCSPLRVIRIPACALPASRRALRVKTVSLGIALA
jgi:hypothetical protein